MQDIQYVTGMIVVCTTAGMDCDTLESQDHDKAN